MALDLRTYGRRNNHDRGFDGVVREGNRGGQGLFKWTDVASDKHRLVCIMCRVHSAAENFTQGKLPWSFRQCARWSMAEK